MAKKSKKQAKQRARRLEKREERKQEPEPTPSEKLLERIRFERRVRHERTLHRRLADEDRRR